MSYATKKEKSALRDLLRKLPLFDKKGKLLPLKRHHIEIINDEGKTIKRLKLSADALNEMIEYYLGAD